MIAAQIVNYVNHSEDTMLELNGWRVLFVVIRLLSL